MTGDRGDASLVDRILNAACNHLQMDAAYVSEITPSAQIVRFATGRTAALGLDPGTKIPLEETYCDLVVAGHLPSIVPDTTAEPLTRDLPPTEIIGSYIGVPVHLASGHVYGTLCCASAARNETLSRRDIQFLHALAELIAGMQEQAGMNTPPLHPRAGGRLRVRELTTGVGASS
jgi:GAF domain-containing protein